MKKKGKTSPAELRAVVVLCAVIGTAIGFPYLRQVFFPEKTVIADPSVTEEYIRRQYERQKRSAEKQWDKSDEKATEKWSRKTWRTDDWKKPALRRDSTVTHPSPKISCQPFDPNLISAEELIAMGVKTYIAGNFIRFRDAGARFSKADDLRRVYGIDSVIFDQLSPCISISSVPQSVAASPMFTLDINHSDKEEWKALPGIGDALASRIVKYRDGLGGFHSVDQVGETFGLPPETFNRIADRLVISDSPKRINLNHATAEELANHPYITQRQAEAIINYRQNHGAFAMPEDVLKIFALNDAWFARVQPYLSTATLPEGPSEIVVR